MFSFSTLSPSQFSNQTTAGRQTGVPMLQGSSFSFWRSSSLSSLLLSIGSSSLVQVDLCIVTLYCLSETNEWQLKYVESNQLFTPHHSFTANLASRNNLQTRGKQDENVTNKKNPRKTNREAFEGFVWSISCLFQMSFSLHTLCSAAVG